MCLIGICKPTSVVSCFWLQIIPTLSGSSYRAHFSRSAYRTPMSAKSRSHARWHGLITIYLTVMGAVIGRCTAATMPGRQGVSFTNFDPYTDQQWRRLQVVPPGQLDCRNEESVVTGKFCNVYNATGSNINETNIPCAGTSTCCVYSGTCRNAEADACQ